MEDEFERKLERCKEVMGGIELILENFRRVNQLREESNRKEKEGGKPRVLCPHAVFTLYEDDGKPLTFCIYTEPRFIDCEGRVTFLGKGETLPFPIGIPGTMGYECEKLGVFCYYGGLRVPNFPEIRRRGIKLARTGIREQLTDEQLSLLLFDFDIPPESIPRELRQKLVEKMREGKAVVYWYLYPLVVWELIKPLILERITEEIKEIIEELGDYKRGKKQPKEGFYRTHLKMWDRLTYLLDLSEEIKNNNRKI